MPVIQIGRRTHLVTHEVEEQVSNIKYRRVTGEISNACAVTIASWWAGPREGDGLSLAELSTSGHLDTDRVADDIYNARKQATAPWDQYTLDLLGTWLLQYQLADDPGKSGRTDTVEDLIARP